MQRQNWCVVLSVAAILLGLAILAGPAGAGTDFPLPQGMVDLGSLQAHGSTPPGPYDTTDFSYAKGLNDLGQVVGETNVIISSNTGNVSVVHPFLWTQTGGMQDLGIPPSANATDTFSAFGINNAGVIIVNHQFWYNADEHYDRAWKLTPGAVQPWSQLASYANQGHPFTTAYGLNQNGEVAGVAESPMVTDPNTYVTQACKWSGGGLALLGGAYPFYGGDSAAYAINDNGAAVGQGYAIDPREYPGYTIPRHALIWDAAGHMTDLGALLEHTSDPTQWYVSSWATVINNNGAVVGYYRDNAEVYNADLAFMWTPAGGMVKLGPMTPNGWSHPTGINDNGQVTGWGRGDFGINHAFRWQDGVWSDLGALGDRYTNNGYYLAYSLGHAINKWGQVAGRTVGKDANGNNLGDHAFFIDPKWPTPGLLASYPFEGNAHDASGHGYDGQVFGATLTQGYQGQAYYFNGVDNYIKVKLDISPSQQWDVTMGGWFKAVSASYPYLGQIFLGNIRGFGGRALGIMDGKWSAFWGADDGHWLIGDPVAAGTWTFVAASYDQAAKTLKFYVNDKIYTKTADTLFLDEGDPYLGLGAQVMTSIGNPDYLSFPFYGAMDQVFIYNGVLTDAQIAAIRGGGPTPIIDYGNFGDLSGFTLNGDAVTAPVDGMLRLTTAESWKRGSAFITTPIPLANNTSFSTAFSFQMTNPGGLGEGADGLLFVVQAQGATALGNAGGGIGYETINHSLGVEFDTYQNGWDPDNNHVGIDFNGNITSVATSHQTQPFNDGNPCYAWVDYNGVSKILEVRFSRTNVRPAAATLSQPVNLPALLGTNQAWVGFTAATGDGWETHDLRSWTFSTLTPLSRRAISAILPLLLLN
jgi:probable HAF family extracellular repeat protein